MKKLALFALVGIFAGCHAGAQIPPTSHTLTITVTNAPCQAGAPASQCGYVFSEAVVTGSSCPSTSGANYAPVNQSAPVAQPSSGNASFVDSGVAGKNVCAIAQTVQGGAVSQPSAAIGPFVVPANPTAPALGSGVIAEVKPALPLLPTNETVAKLEIKAVVR